jgi:hypothetical protein
MDLSGQLLTPPAWRLRKNYGTHWKGNWVHPGVILSILEKTQSLVYASIQTQFYPGHSLVASPATLSLFLFSPKYINSEIHTTFTVHMLLQLTLSSPVMPRGVTGLERVKQETRYTVQRSWNPRKIQSHTLYHLTSLSKRCKSDTLNHLQQLGTLRNKY